MLTRGRTALDKDTIMINNVQKPKTDLISRDGITNKPSIPTNLVESAQYQATIGSLITRDKKNALILFGFLIDIIFVSENP